MWLSSLNERFPRLGDENGWAASFGRELNATAARPHHTDRGVRIVEGKHLSPFVVDVRSGNCLDRAALPHLIDPSRITGARLGYRDVSGVGNRLTLIAAVIPAGVITTHTVFCLKNHFDADKQHFLCALLNSYVLNAVVRLLMGSHVTTTLTAQLPVPTWRGDAADRRIAALARQLSDGSANPEAGARLQALVAHRFDLTLSDLFYVLDGFPLVAEEEKAVVIRHFEMDGM